MCRILILADIRPMGYKLSCCGLGKNLLFKSILGRCVRTITTMHSEKFSCEIYVTILVGSISNQIQDGFYMFIHFVLHRYFINHLV